MNISKTLNGIKDTYELSDSFLSEMLHTSTKRIKEILENKSDIKEEERDYLLNSLNIKSLDNLNIEDITIRKKINTHKYKNIFNAYVEILKEHYPKPWKIYVVAKIRKKGFYEEFKDMFFGNLKKEVDKEMSIFNPMYIAIKKDKYLLITITKDYIEIDKLPESAKEKRFVYKNYRYSRANEIDLDKYSKKDTK